MRDAAEHLSEYLTEHPKTGMLMVRVPKGKFLTDTYGGKNNYPGVSVGPFEVNLAAYYMAVHPVTNAQYARFVAETGHRKPEQADYGTPVWNNGTFPPENADHPVVCVTWEDAYAYCRWAGLRLPKELEWEKAARGLDCRAYPWGTEWDSDRCQNCYTDDGETTAGVWRYGQGGAPFGGIQFSGNVNEWCADYYDEDVYSHYRHGLRLHDSPSGSQRVWRGGSWRLTGQNCCSASYRGRNRPDYCNADIGFRCAGEVGASP
jgi:formylglycine-generating enzyme required for sulfatase activity